jgi:hypothetical protein
MSTSYQAVGWNRQKKIYDWIIFCFCMLYIAVFSGLTLAYNPQVTFETLLIRSTSTLAVLLLTIILSIGPLCRINNKFLPLLYNRRHLGVYHVHNRACSWLVRNFSISCIGQHQSVGFSFYFEHSLWFTG